MEIENIPLFSYFGNKDNEMKEIIKHIPNMNNTDIIIEPYCGSFALIRYLLTIYPNKTYICNDNDEMLIKVYKTLQNNAKCKELINFFLSLKLKTKNTTMNSRKRIV